MRHLRPADSFFAHCAKISPTTNGGPVGARIVDEVDGLFRFGVCDEALFKGKLVAANCLLACEELTPAKSVSKATLGVAGGAVNPVRFAFEHSSPPGRSQRHRFRCELAFA